ncbi:MAG TPA: methylmalonyl-CoA mutase family protein, partial [Anaerolineae bacterium]|nr:methylmalonyl-CoA mutase family protein [Anaerolineae bacterium]
DTPDPLAGSYYVVSLTDQLEAAAQAYLDEIDAMGGAIAAIDRGYQQRHIQDAAYRVQREIEAADRIVVGVNRFTDDEVVTPALQRIDPALEREQVARLQALRSARDETAWGSALDRLEAAARGTDNVLPAMIDAVKAQATLGEISDRLRAIWGEHREVVTV